MSAIRYFITIVDLQTVLVTLLAIVSTWLCIQLGWSANMPTGLIGVAIVFPIVFSINAAYRRREQALSHFASIKAHSMALFYVHRDWTPGGQGDGHSDRARALIDNMLMAIKDYFKANKTEREVHLVQVYMTFSNFSKSNEVLRLSEVPANEISRSNQYLRAMMIDFERMRNILTYRTPVTLRAYSRIFLNSFPIVFGPYFAYLSNNNPPVIGYVVAVLYSLVLVSLDNIQEGLENPFDGIGKDDIQLDASQEYLRLM